MPMLSLLRSNHRLPLFHMSKQIGLKRKNNVLTSFQLGIRLIYNWILTNHLDIKWNIYINNTSGSITQPYIRATLAKNKTRVLAFLMFYDTRKIQRKLSKCWVVSFILYSIIMFVLIIYLMNQKIKLTTCWFYWGI